MSGSFDIIVIGAGMAGMSAALTAGRLGRSVALLSSGVPGGQLLSIEHIDGVPGVEGAVAGYDLCPITQEQCEAAGVVLVTEAAEAVRAEGDDWIVTSAAGEFQARGVVVASGAALARLGVPGETDHEGRGVSDCASCDAPLLRGKKAVVAGGGDSAMQEALVVAEHAAHVLLVTTGEALQGQADYRARIESHERIDVRYGTQVSEVLGDEGGVTGVRLLADGGASEKVATDALFVFTGLVPNTAFLGNFLSLDTRGHVRVDAALRTARRGICAAGNVRSGGAFRAASVMGDGAVAATTLNAYLSTGAWPEGE